MLITFSFVFIILIFCSFYINRFKKKRTGFLLIISMISVPTIIIYLTKGNLESYVFEEKLNQVIEGGLKNPEEFEKISPQLLIIFLENKLQKDPQDLQGWLILSRACVISGHYQKADKYYQTALKLFPTNENLLLEISLLKKNINQTKSAENYLYKLKNLYPGNIKAREMLIEIFMNNSLNSQAFKELKELLIMKKEDKEYVENIKRKYNLD